MSTAKVSPEVHRLLSKHVDSFEKLELLVALDEASEKQLARTTLAQQLQLRTDVVKQCLAELEASGLIETHEDLVRLDTAGDKQGLAELLRLYAEDRLAIMTTLSTIAMDRIRGMAARAFADAFDMRKKQKGEDDG